MGVKGEKVYDCQYCQEYKTESIPMLMEFRGTVDAQNNNQWTLELSTEQGQYLETMQSGYPHFQTTIREGGRYNCTLWCRYHVPKVFSLQWETGTVYVTLPDTHLVAKGNLNGDGLTDVGDMECLFTYLSTNQRVGQLRSDEEYFLTVADVNTDGTVDILDYQALYDQLRS